MPDGMQVDANTRHLWRMNNDGSYPAIKVAAASLGGVDFDEGWSMPARGPGGGKAFARLTSFAIKNNGIEGALATATNVDAALIDSYSHGAGFWINVGDVTLRNQLLVEYAAGGNIGIGCRVLTTGAIQIFWDPGFANSVSSAGIVSSDTWHHIAWRVLDAGGGQQTAEIYVDGVLATTLTAAYPSSNVNQQWVIGNAAHSGILSNADALDGRIADLVIYSSTPAVSLIQTEATNPGGNYTQADTGVSRHWNFQEPPALLDEADGLHMGPPRPWITTGVTSLLSAIRDAVPPTRRCWDFGGSQDGKFRGFTHAQPLAEALRQLFIAGDYTIEVYVAANSYSPASGQSIVGFVGDDTGDANAPADNTLGRLQIVSPNQLNTFWEHGAGNNEGATTTVASTVAGDVHVPQYFAITVENTGATRTVRFHNSEGFVEEFTGITAPDGGDAPEGGPAIGSSSPTDIAASMFTGAIFEVRISDKVRTPAELDDSRARLFGTAGGGGTVVRTNPLLVRSDP